MFSPASLIAIACSTWLLLQSSIVFAAEITVRKRDNAFAISGEMVSSDHQGWVIAVDGVGDLAVSAQSFVCVSGPCSDDQQSQAVAAIPPGSPLTTTWIGGSDIGTEALPRLIKAFAASLGASASLKIGADVKNLEYSLNGADGRLIGRINIERQGEAAGLSALAKDQADVVWARRPVFSDYGVVTPAPAAADVTAAYLRHPWAQDALTVLVSQENPVTSLSLDDIAKVFSGQIKDWSELGQPAGKINVYAPSSEMGAWDQFDSQVLKPRGVSLTDAAKRFVHATQWSDEVANDRHGIGVSPFAFVRKAKAISISRSCGLSSVASIFTAKAGEYPLVGQLYFYTAGKLKNPLAAALLSFVMSDKAQPVLKSAGLIDRDPETVGFNDQAGRIAVDSGMSARTESPALLSTLIKDTRAAQRLSLTFRFGSSTANLDARSVNDIGKLANFVTSKSSAARSVLLLGFADSVGSRESNAAVAGGRAARVHDALLKVVGTALPQGTNIVHSAYGALAPVSCNQTADERALNRRVEVWVR